MTPPDSTGSAPSTSAPVSLAADDVLALANSVDTIVSLAVPGSAAIVAAVTGLAGFLRSSVLPAIEHFSAAEKTVVEQATVAAESAAERLRLGVQPATDN